MREQNKWRKYIPHLHFYLDIPLIKIQTIMLCEAYERMVFEVCRLRIEIWKWKLEFELYYK